jgi:hypothetical protein
MDTVKIFTNFEEISEKLKFIKSRIHSILLLIFNYVLGASKF